MYQFFETIRLENGILHNLVYHQKRVDHTFNKKFPGCRTHDLESISSAHNLPSGLHKFRISYNHKSYSVKIEAYHRKYPSSLKLIEDDDIEYEYKSEDRQDIDTLFGLRSDYDDILIIKNGYVTDTSFGNICFKNI